MPEQDKRALDAIGLEEQGAAVGLRDGALWEGRTSPHPPSRRRDTPAPPQDERPTARAMDSFG